jgi:hypothetical protein
MVMVAVEQSHPGHATQALTLAFQVACFPETVVTAERADEHRRRWAWILDPDAPDPRARTA